MESRHLKTPKEDLHETKKLYNEIVSVASVGLFFRTGQILGKKIADISNKEREKYFEVARNLLIENGWVIDIQFSEDKIIVTKSIEVEKSKNPNCHMLRGVISRLYEEYYRAKIICTETACESSGGEKCIFNIQR